MLLLEVKVQYTINIYMYISIRARRDARISIYVRIYVYAIDRVRPSVPHGSATHNLYISTSTADVFLSPRRDFFPSLCRWQFVVTVWRKFSLSFLPRTSAHTAVSVLWY